MKYLLILIAAVVVLMLHKHNRAQRMPPPTAGTRKAAPPEPMHACRHCGVHVPASRCVWVGDKPYCCAEHARLG